MLTLRDHGEKELAEMGLADKAFEIFLKASKYFNRKPKTNMGRDDCDIILDYEFGCYSAEYYSDEIRLAGRRGGVHWHTKELLKERPTNWFIRIWYPTAKRKHRMRPSYFNGACFDMKIVKEGFMRPKKGIFYNVIELSPADYERIEQLIEQDMEKAREQVAAIEYLHWQETRLWDCCNKRILPPVYEYKYETEEKTVVYLIDLVAICNAFNDGYGELMTAEKLWKENFDLGGRKSLHAHSEKHVIQFDLDREGRVVSPETGEQVWNCALGDSNNTDFSQPLETRTNYVATWESLLVPLWWSEKVLQRFYDSLESAKNEIKAILEV